MNSHPNKWPITRRIAALMLLCLGLASFAFAQSESVIYNFTGNTNNAPNLTADGAGNLYGTLLGQFVVFQLTPTTGGGWTYAAIGSSPGNVSSLAVDKNGNVFGTTTTGGIIAPTCIQGCGTVFEISPPSEPGGSWQETTIYEFTHGDDGGVVPSPTGITVGRDGVLYGGARYAGRYGVVFGLRPPGASGGSWTSFVAYRFQGGADGAYPTGSFAIDKQGNLYGTTLAGGVSNSNCLNGAPYETCGTVFELSPPAAPGGVFTKTTLYAFNGPPGDGNFPNAGLVMDASGNLYGSTWYGGTSYTDTGTVFELTPSNGVWSETLLYSFPDKVDASTPIGLTAGPGGDLYGASWGGGAYGAGAVFQLARSSAGWTEKVIYDFQQGAPPQGADPDTNLVYVSGALYGATSAGGTGEGTACSGGSFGCGVVYQIVK